MTAADRNAVSRALKSAGIVRLVIFADKNWTAEMLYRVGGFCHADEDDRAALEEAAQRLFDWLIEQAQNETAIRVSPGDFDNG
jgi:hypothetical protein